MPNSDLPERWDREADVVIVGFGAAGAVAAITAHGAGPNVLILEKAPLEEAGGNTKVSFISLLISRSESPATLLNVATQSRATWMLQHTKAY